MGSFESVRNSLNDCHVWSKSLFDSVLDCSTSKNGNVTQAYDKSRGSFPFGGKTGSVRPWIEKGARVRVCSAVATSGKKS